MKKHFCEIAIAMAEESEHHFQVGSVIVKGRHIISLAHNSKKKTHPLIMKATGNKSLVDKLHSEQAAILKARTDLVGAKIYVARKKALGLGTSRPCRHCFKMIKAAGIKKIYYTTDNGWVCEKIERGLI